MKQRTYLLLGLLVLLPTILVGCGGGGGGGLTGPANAPIISTVTVRPNPANPGATLIFEVEFVDVPGDLNGGTAVITDSQGNNYQGLISNAEGTAGVLVTSIQLSPLVAPGELLFTVYVVDLAGNSSQPLYVTVIVS